MIRTLQCEQWQAYRAIRLRALLEAPDAFGSTLAREEALALHVWEARVAQSVVSGIDCPLVADAGGEFVALAWVKVDADDPGIVNLFQMWVAPAWRGKGVAQALLRQATGWAVERRAQALQLGVNCANGAAMSLYARTGFVAVGVPVPMRDGAALMEQTMRLQLSR
ncbi:GNAT family N-acetyltransferase [Massilia sp. H6]|uniref:GNAT family N-acetyltransferase n=1 Tax=Massilia sp. H6 TaxID=2970464 RepID=UPI0021674446|nr:GNAT family N-acetyltransferase [Massilia sp. H6]UVW29443.1 GNAT family N-acetyltransferase [Massilia sp. H6]